MKLGQPTAYDKTYNPKLLFPIRRAEKRAEINVDESALPFKGIDSWNHYEVSWLNAKGKPVVATAEIHFDCASPFMIESKSMKLYFNSLNNTKFNSTDELTAIIKKDLEKNIQSKVTINLMPINESLSCNIQMNFSGICLDQLDIDCDTYLTEPNFLTTENKWTEETVYSNLLKSNCLVTSQPDWGSVQIRYQGKQINHEGLLRYIVSFRNHIEFHEQCIERMFMDIMRRCQPEALTVYGRYTRRGGIDINPFRSTHLSRPEDLALRLVRQ